jgi:DNA-binding LacI/PurR family transcriptional regulator
MASDDARAVMVSRACRRAGLRVPEDVAIVGVNDDESLCAFGDPPLTSVALPCLSIKQVAAALRFRRPGELSRFCRHRTRQSPLALRAAECRT